MLSGLAGPWELYDGQMRERLGMSWEHGRVVMLLARQLLLHLDPREFELRINEGRVRFGWGDGWTGSRNPREPPISKHPITPSPITHVMMLLPETEPFV